MIRIGIVDDHAIVRSGLKQFFSEHVDLRVVGEAASGREAIDLVRTTEMDVLVMDLSMPGQSGIDALAMIRAKAPDVGILILSGYPEEHYAMNLIRQGASGYLNKECDPAEIVEAIRTIALGKRYITPTVAELLAQQLNRKNDALPHEQLSEREFQVFLKQGSGLGVLKACRERNPEQKVVVLTNYATPDIRVRCHQLGVDAVFDKSNDIEALIDFCLEMKGNA